MPWILNSSFWNRTWKVIIGINLFANNCTFSTTILNWRGWSLMKDFIHPLMKSFTKLSHLNKLRLYTS